MYGEDDVEYLQFRRLIEYEEKIEHCYTIKPLNFNMSDEKETLKNYEKICKALNLDSKKIYRPGQTHSINIIKVEDEQSQGIYKIKNTDRVNYKQIKQNIITYVCGLYTVVLL